MNIRDFISHFGLEEWIFALTSLVTIVFSILSFLGILPFDENQISSITIGALGLLMAAITTHMARTRLEITELKKVLGIVDTQLLSLEEFAMHLPLSVIRTESSISEAFMNIPKARPASPYSLLSSQTSLFFSDWPEKYRAKLFQRVYRGEITFRRVQLIPNKEVLEDVIFRLLLHEGCPYYLRCYEAPENELPMINIMSFDERYFYQSAYYPDVPALDTMFLYVREHIREPELRHWRNWFHHYWSIVWAHSEPLNGERYINWERLKDFGSKFGMMSAEFDSMVYEVKHRVEEERSQILTSKTL